MAFLCDGAAAADGANAQLLRDGAAAVAAFLCDGAAAAVVLRFNAARTLFYVNYTQNEERCFDAAWTLFYVDYTRNDYLTLCIYM